ncbi:MAG: ATP synthase F1 subunit gamma [Bacteroidota bacterium]|jgi:F-type H+-transporting ATPase subunit gamma
MPGNLKEVRNRIKSVGNTQQITKAMKMVSAAKLRRAQDRIIQMRPYANKLQDMLSNIIAASEGDVNMALAKEREIKKVLIVVITSDRGLCGGFNSNLIKRAKQLIAEKYSIQEKNSSISIMPVGKKAYDAFKRSKYAIQEQFVGLFSNLTFDATTVVSQWMMNQYAEGQYDAIELVYAQFKNAATQVFTAEQYLPVPKPDHNGKKNKTDFIFEPNQTEIVNYLVPKILNTQFFKALIDSNASEHGARMTAMDKASDNANELLKDLRIQYNRQRQAAITTELTEIVSGAQALAGG